ncbi:MAG: hypothetical protein J6Y10_06955 [Lachnospiraceae bacterium]|nr:hypothetical protein [Lachnospiraceae bacterium]
MSNKGASNRYGNTRNGRQGHPTSHTGFAWARGFNNTTAQDHFNRHGSQVGAPTLSSYVAKAVSYANTVNRKDVESFVDSRGSTYKYNKVTNEFAVITRSGVVVTYYKPADGRAYYLAQKKEKAKRYAKRK